MCQLCKFLEPPPTRRPIGSRLDMTDDLPVEYLLEYVDSVRSIFSLLVHGSLETKSRAQLYTAVSNVLAMCTPHAVEGESHGRTPRKSMNERFGVHVREHADGITEILFNDVLNATQEKVSYHAVGGRTGKVAD